LRPEAEVLLLLFELCTPGEKLTLCGLMRLVSVIMNVFLGGRDSALSCAEAVLSAGQARGIGGVGKAECVEFGCNVWGDSDESVGNARLGRSTLIVGAERCRCEGLVAVGDGGEEMRSFAREVFSVACSGLRHGTTCARPSGDGGVRDVRQ
jgi:hypothetical protein